ncbi:MAG: signal peptidase I [Gammaproteobacteria bacterium]|nr:signal peptidase I [Gammaproteobacteria bacterium]
MKTQLRRLWRENRSLALFLLLMVAFRSSFADWNTVPTGSMQPTIVEGDRILVDKLAYDLKLPLSDISLVRLGEPKRGDIVVFNSKAAGTRLVKRVMGLPGDTVAMKDNLLIINGVPAGYSDIRSTGEGVFAVETVGELRHRVRFAPQAGGLSSFGPVRVPEGQYLMLGDNRDNSADSRVIGFVPREELAGNAETVVLSLNYDNYYLPRGERFLHTL